MTTYKFDGFRFDLMGLLDVDTMNKVYDELKVINPNLIILGEGWDMGTLDPSIRANQNNANKLPNIAFFNDDIRDAIKGSTFNTIGRGFVSNNKGLEKLVIENIKGGKNIKSYTKPAQLIQHVEARDNMTLYDQLKKTIPEESLDNIIKRHRLSSTIIMLSNGIPFIHSGQEFLRTKKGVENSYKSPDSINMIDYDRAYKYKDYVNYFKERKNYYQFNLKDYKTIDSKFKVIKDTDFVIAYQIDNMYVIFNANDKEISLEIEKGKYKTLIKNNIANHLGIEYINIEDNITISALETLVLEKQ